MLITANTFVLGQSLFDENEFHTLRFAHRGGYSEKWAENTIPTIVHNIVVLGAKAVEIDVEVTADFQLVAFHDKTLTKLLHTDSEKTINEISLHELRSMTIRGHEDLEVPTLQQIADTLIYLAQHHDFILELDFKPTSEPAIIELMRIIIESELQLGEGLYNYFFISSFYPKALKSIRSKSNKIRTAFAVHSQPNENKLAAKAAIILAPIIIRKNECTIIEPNQCMVTKRFVKKWKKKNILINTYTVNSPCEKKYIASLGIAYTTNCIDGFCEKDFSGQTATPGKWCKKCD